MDKENLLGITKGTVLEEAIERNFNGETSEVGLYLAMCRQAEEEGYSEAALVLRQIAWEEAAHAARFAQLNGKISTSLKENLERMLKGELGACGGKYESAKKAREAGIDAAHDCLHEASRDEARHAGMLQGLLKKYF